jgi:hypothetical protein
METGADAARTPAQAFPNRRMEVPLSAKSHPS